MLAAALALVLPAGASALPHPDAAPGARCAHVMPGRYATTIGFGFTRGRLTVWVTVRFVPRPGGRAYCP
jgi:hypothetical protein